MRYFVRTRFGVIFIHANGEPFPTTLQIPATSRGDAKIATKGISAPFQANLAIILDAGFVFARIPVP